MYQCILVGFSCKACCKVDFGHAKISNTIYLGQSLLLSTTVLNDEQTQMLANYSNAHQL